MEAMLVSLRLGAKIPKPSLAAALRHCIVAAFIRSFTTMIPCRPTLLAWPSSHRRALGLANYKDTAFATCNQPSVSASNAGGLFLPAILECIASNALSHLAAGLARGARRPSRSGRFRGPARRRGGAAAHKGGTHAAGRRAPHAEAGTGAQATGCAPRPRRGPQIASVCCMPSYGRTRSNAKAFGLATVIGQHRAKAGVSAQDSNPSSYRWRWRMAMANPFHVAQPRTAKRA